MKVKNLTIDDSAYPSLLKARPGAPPELHVLGADLAEIMARPRVAIVGSRGVSPYGRQVYRTTGRGNWRGMALLSSAAWH